MSELAERVLLSRSGLTRLVDRLEREGLVAPGALRGRRPRALHRAHRRRLRPAARGERHPPARCRSSTATGRLDDAEAARARRPAGPHRWTTSQVPADRDRREGQTLGSPGRVGAGPAHQARSRSTSQSDRRPVCPHCSQVCLASAAGAATADAGRPARSSDDPRAVRAGHLAPPRAVTDSRVRHRPRLLPTPAAVRRGSGEGPAQSRGLTRATSSKVVSPASALASRGVAQRAHPAGRGPDDGALGRVAAEHPAQVLVDEQHLVDAGASAVAGLCRTPRSPRRAAGSPRRASTGRRRATRAGRGPGSSGTDAALARAGAPAAARPRRSATRRP